MSPLNAGRHGLREPQLQSFFETSRGLTPALQLDDAAPGGERHRLREIVGAQLVHDAFHMGLDGFLGDEQFRADLPIPVPRRDLLEHFHFALAQSLVAKNLGDHPKTGQA
jgi:hypothetical protein